VRRSITARGSAPDRTVTSQRGVLARAKRVGGSETTGILRKMALMAIELNHYAFKVIEEEFDAIFGRIKAEGLPYGSEPHSRADMKINHRSGGRGVYFCDRNAHILELLTVG